MNIDVQKKRSLEVSNPDHDAEMVNLGVALSSKTRVEMLRLVNKHPYTVTELAHALYISASSVLFHVNLLQKAKLVRVDTTKKGKVDVRMVSGFMLYYDLSFIMDVPQSRQELQEIRHDVAVGAYSEVGGFTRFGIVSSEGDPLSEPYVPGHTTASIIWLDKGFVEYKFPNKFCASMDVKEITFSLEICSEAPYYRNDWKSDITFSFEGRELCTYTSPQDFGERRGSLNPTWWADTHTQYGQLIKICIAREGTFLNGEKKSDVCVSDFALGKNEGVTFRIECKEDAQNVGGFNLFSKMLGDYEQDIVMAVVGTKK